MAGCAQRPTRVKVTPTVVSTSQLAGLVANAVHEWERWGQRTVRAVPGLPLCLQQLDGSCVKVEDGCGDEQTAELCPLVHTYWSQVLPGKTRHSCGLVDVCSVTWPVGDPRVPEYTEPWSAVFVSSMLIQAGFSSTEFMPSTNHAGYVAASRDGYTSAFEVVPTPAVPRVGDIVCATRGTSHLTPTQLDRIGYDGPAMHCDIAVDVDAQHRLLHVIGGNVQQTVARTLVPLDDEGRLTFIDNSDRPWILILKARRATITEESMATR